MLWIWIPLRRGVLDTTLCDKVCQCLVAGRWFSPVSSTNKTYRHDTTEILLMAAWNTITLTLTHPYQTLVIMYFSTFITAVILYILVVLTLQYLKHFDIWYTCHIGCQLYISNINPENIYVFKGQWISQFLRLSMKIDTNKNKWYHSKHQDEWPLPLNVIIITVKPVYKGHSREPENLIFKSSCPLYTG